MATKQKTEKPTKTLAQQRAEMRAELEAGQREIAARSRLLRILAALAARAPGRTVYVTRAETEAFADLLAMSEDEEGIQISISTRETFGQ